MIPTIKKLQSNITKIGITADSAIWFSYAEPVALTTSDKGAMITDEAFSPTTERHKRVIAADMGSTVKALTVPCESFADTINALRVSVNA